MKRLAVILFVILALPCLPAIAMADGRTEWWWWIICFLMEAGGLWNVY